MPTSEDTITRLLDLIETLKAENSALIAELIKIKTGEVTNEIPSPQTSLGIEPWYLLKARLERAHRKKSLTEITGIPVNNQDDPLSELE